VNLNKCYLLAQVEIANKIKKLDNFLMLLQEPYCYKGKACLVPQNVDKIGHDDNPRAYILASKGLAVSKVTHLCSRDYAVGLTKLGGKQTLVVSAYLDILLSPISREMIDIIQFADRRRFALLIAVDSNAHSKLWMSRDNNSRGRIITEELPPMRPWDKADWAMFSNEVSKSAIRLPEYINYGVVEKLVEQLYDCIERAIDKACPKTKASKVVLSNPWFTKGLLSKRKEVFALWDKYMANKSQDNWNKYKSKRRNYKKHCDKVKRKYRNSYKEKLGDTKSMANFVQSITKPVAPDIGTVKRPDGSYTLPGEETLHALADIHFPGHGSTERRQSIQAFTYKEVVDSNQEWINPDRIAKAFHDFKAKKSPGTDGLKPILLKHLPKSMIQIIELIYKAMVKLQYTPLEWCKARVVFIPKPGKPDYTSPKAFRPISLTNYLLKGIEKLTRWKMDEMLALHPIDSHQHGQSVLPRGVSRHSICI